MDVHIEEEKVTRKHESMFHSAASDALHVEWRTNNIDLSLITIAAALILNIGKIT